MKGRTIRRISAWSRWLSYLCAASAGLLGAQFYLSGWNMLWFWLCLAAVALGIACLVVEFKMHEKWRRGW